MFKLEDKMGRISEWVCKELKLGDIFKK